MQRHLGLVCASVALLELAPLLAWGAPAPIRLHDYRQLVRIVSPQFSPDGQQLALLTVASDFVHDRYDATLRVMAASGGASRVLVQGVHDLQMPRWSPDGRTLAFVARQVIALR